MSFYPQIQKINIVFSSASPPMAIELLHLAQALAALAPLLAPAAVAEEVLWQRVDHRGTGLSLQEVGGYSLPGLAAHQLGREDLFLICSHEGRTFVAADSSASQVTTPTDEFLCWARFKGKHELYALYGRRRLSWPYNHFLRASLMFQMLFSCMILQMSVSKTFSLLQ